MTTMCSWRCRARRRTSARALLALLRRSRDDIAAAAGVPAPAVLRVTVHPTVESFGRATGQPWHVAGATGPRGIDLLPLTSAAAKRPARARGAARGGARGGRSAAAEPPTLGTGRRRRLLRGAAGVWCGACHGVSGRCRAASPGDARGATAGVRESRDVLQTGVGPGRELAGRAVDAVRARSVEASAPSTATRASLAPTNSSSVVPGADRAGRHGTSCVHGAQTRRQTIAVAASTCSGCSESRSAARVGFHAPPRIARHHTSAANGATTQRSHRLAQAAARNSQRHVGPVELGDEPRADLAAVQLHPPSAAQHEPPDRRHEQAGSTPAGSVAHGAADQAR